MSGRLRRYTRENVYRLRWYVFDARDMLPEVIARYTVCQVRGHLPQRKMHCFICRRCRLVVPDPPR